MTYATFNVQNAPAARRADPIAALLDATVDAQHLGCCESDVVLLQEIGEDIADFAAKLTEKLMRLSDGRMGTSWAGRIERRSAVNFDIANVTDGVVDYVAGELDAVALIRAAAVLRLERQQLQLKAA